VTGSEPDRDKATVAEPRRPRLVFLGVGIVLATALGIGLFSSLGTPKQVVPAVGTTAPSFTLGRLGGGGTVGTPADGGGSGHPVVLVFFASWCTPCAAEVPALAAVYRHQNPDSRIPLIGIDGMDPTKDALAFVRHSGVGFPVAVDPAYQVTEGLYYFTGDPDAVFINSDGTIARIVRGPITGPQLTSWEHRLH
jgi:cytochrome c biogenesis protein CcmG/thiol:disulfide interchange protein DsbE